MKINIDCACEESLFEITEMQKSVLCHDIAVETLDENLKERLKYILTHKYKQCFKRLKAEWEPKLAARGVESLPTDKDAFAELVFSQPDYKDKSVREAEYRASLIKG